MPKQTIEVTIMGQTYTLTGDADEAYIRELARMVDVRMKELFERNPTINPLKAAIMTAVNMADQILKYEKQADAANEYLSEKVKALNNLLEV
ncbi:MAG: cell division protein ZapA [Thermodesulfobacteriota bacterium]